MNDAGIFVAGLAVTLMIGAAIALLVWGAVLDGRAQQARERGEPGP